VSEARSARPRAAPRGAPPQPFRKAAIALAGERAEHEPAAHVGAVGEQRVPRVGALPDDALDLGHGVGVGGGEAAGEGADGLVELGPPGDDARVEPVLVRPGGVAPVGVDAMAVNAARPILRSMTGPTTNGPDAHGELAELAARPLDGHGVVGRGDEPDAARPPPFRARGRRRTSGTAAWRG
jgi:hypothetical protein